MLIVVVASGIGVLVALTVGPRIGVLLFGAKFTLSGLSLAALTAGCCLVVLALTLAQALIALRHYAWMALGWVVAVGIFVVVMTLPIDDLFTRSEIAFLTGSIVAVGWMLFAISRASKALIRSGTPLRST